MDKNFRRKFETASATQKRYLYQVKNYFKSGEKFENYLKKLDRKELSKFKNGLKLLDLKNKDELIEKCSNHLASKYRKNSEEQLKVKDLELKINRLKSKRLKLAFRLQEISGLRVAEIANLTSKNILLDTNKNIKIQVLNGKYGKDRLVNCFYDEWVFNELLSLKSKKNNKLFCTKEYMMKTARKLGFHTHELRKIYAHTFFYNCVEDKEITLELLAENMGHGHIKETYVYLNRDVNTNNSKIGKVKPFVANDLTR